MQRGWNRHAKFVLLSQLDALEHVVGCKILPGDKVTIELSTYDLTRGRITYRHK